MEALRHAQAEADRLEIRDDTTEPAEPRRKSGEGCFGGFM
jgi:hypothetical protein